MMTNGFRRLLMIGLEHWLDFLAGIEVQEKKQIETGGRYVAKSQEHIYMIYGVWRGSSTVGCRTRQRKE